MYNENIMGKIGYFVENVAWALVSMFWYVNTLFRSLPGQTLTASKITLWGLLLSLAAIGFLITLKNRRNDMSVFVNVMLPYEVYTLLAFGQDMFALAVVAIATSVVVCSGYIAIVLSRKVMNEARRKQIMQRRVKFGLLGSRTIVTFCMMIFIIPISINVVFGGTMVFKGTASEMPTAESEYTIASNIEVVSNLFQDKWITLNNHEKTNVLQTVANIEACYMGLPHELNVKVDTMRESAIAQYNDRTHTIFVNITYLDSWSAMKMLDSICHESFHAYQHRLINAYNSMEAEYKNLMLFYHAPIYEEEFQNYVTGETDPLGYYFQTCEKEARTYAKDRTIVYYDEINFYISFGDEVAGQ